jgi:hypothetical protein
MPKYKFTDLCELLLSFDHRKETIANEFPILAAVRGPSIRYENLAFRMVGRMEKDLTDSRTASRIFERNSQIEVREWNPRSLSTPASLYQSCAKRQNGAERFARHRR